MKFFKFLNLFIPILYLGILASCSDDDETTSDSTPTAYLFEREVDGAMVSTVSYGGQTTRLKQADELYAALNSENPDGSPRTFTEQELDLMFGGDNNGSSGFYNTELNGTSKIIRSKRSAYANTASNLAVFDGWLAEFANDVAPNLDGTASDGFAGMLDVIN